MSIETTLICLAFYRVMSLNQIPLLHGDRYKSIIHALHCPGYTKSKEKAKKGNIGVKQYENVKHERNTR